jgi:predicted dehydrogenase
MKKVVVVGFGFMGLSHTINILKNPNLQLVAIVDKNPENIENNLSKQAGNFNIGNLTKESITNIKIYSDLDNCIRNENIDACFICVHTDLHYEMTRKALNAGNHVFLEKPICLDLNHGAELIGLAKTNQCILMVGQVVRFMPAYKKLKSWIDSKEFGSLRFLSFTRFSGVPVWGQWKEKQYAFGASGGALFDLVLHDIDFVQYLLGEPDEIKSFTRPGKLSKHDYVSAFWRYARTDIEVKIEGGNTFHAAFPFHAGFTANFEKVSILYTTFQPGFISISTDDGTKNIPVGEANDGFSGEVEYFTSCIEAMAEPLLCTPESSLLSVELCYKHL